jgi:hypothetical protein
MSMGNLTHLTIKTLLKTDHQKTNHIFALIFAYLSVFTLKVTLQHLTLGDYL